MPLDGPDPDADRPTIPGGNGGRIRPGRSVRGPGGQRGQKQRATLAHMALTALDRLGGVHYLMKMGNSKVSSDRSAFMALIGRYVPLQFEGSVDQTLTIKVLSLAPSHGTCVIAEKSEHAPIPAPIEGESSVISDEETAA